MSSSKISTATAIMAIVATSSFLPSQTQAFQPSSTARSLTRNKNVGSRSVGVNDRGIKTKLNMADDNGGELSEVEKLRAAAAKAREEYERLSKVRLSKIRCMLAES